MIKERVEKFSDVAPLVAFLLSGLPELSEESFDNKNLDSTQMQKILQYSVWRLDELQSWERDSLYSALSSLATVLDLKLKVFLAPLFVAIAGSPSAPPLFDSMVVLGPDMSRARLRHGLAVLGSPSKKQLKKLEKEYRQISTQC